MVYAFRPPASIRDLASIRGSTIQLKTLFDVGIKRNFNLLCREFRHVIHVQEDPLTLRGQRNRCRNIKGEPEIFVELPSPRRQPLFPMGVIL